MIILDQDKLRAYWDSIALGFQKSPLEAVLSIIFIVLLVAVPITLFLLKQKKDKARHISRARDVFNEYIDKKGFSESDRQLLVDMSRFAPRGLRDLPNMVRSLSTFNSASKGMIESGEIPDSRVAGLRLQLGLIQHGSRGILHSTAELAPDTVVQMVFNPDRRILASIEEVSVSGLILRVGEKLPGGQSVELRISRPSGVYSIGTWIQSSKRETVTVRHSEKIKRIQKRRFFRKRTRQPVIILTEDPTADKAADETTGSTARAVKSRLLDLSAGGAKIRNPGLKLEKGQNIGLILSLGKGKPVKIPASVIRVSKDGSSVSVNFGPLKASVKERIIRVVFQ